MAALIGASLVLASICSLTILAAAFQFDNTQFSGDDPEMVTLKVQPLSKIAISNSSQISSGVSP